jgi:hypothetical protein
MSDILTREEVAQRCRNVRDLGHLSWESKELLAHDAEQRKRIQQLEFELQQRKDEFHLDAASWRGVESDRICKACGGTGEKVYGNTATWRGGCGGQSMTRGVCDTCWGSGDNQPWTDLRKLLQEREQLQARMQKLEGRKS